MRTTHIYTVGKRMYERERGLVIDCVCFKKEEWKRVGITENLNTFASSYIIP